MTTTTRRLVLVGSLALAGCAGERAEPSAPAARVAAVDGTPSSRGPAQHVARRAMLEVHASYRVPVGSPRETAEALRRVTAFADAHEGWVQSSALDEAGDSGLVTLRVPPDALGELRATLGRLASDGHAVREQIRRTDVTDALADLDARVRVARATETRLLALLDQRTGTLADVLAVERSLAEQRTLIEQLESEQRGAQGRVDLATVEVRLERAVVGGQASLSRQLAAATRDGLSAARAFSTGLVLAALRAGPSLAIVALLGLLGRAGWRLARRRA